MRKWFVSALLTCLIISGCGAAADNGQAGQENNAAQEEQGGGAATNGAAEQPSSGGQDANAPEAGQDGDAAEADGEEADIPLTKEAYTKKLDEVEAGLADLQKLYDEGTTASMSQAAAETFTRWEAAMGDIYSALLRELPDAEALKQEQRDWLDQREAKAEEAAKKFEGGTQAGLELLASKAKTTKERCYELVDKYMQ